MRARSGWRELGSGSDAALLIWAQDFKALLTIGGRAVLCFSARIEHKDARVRRGPSTSVQSFDRSDLLIDWLNEVNYRLIVHRWVTWDPVITSLSENALTCRLDGYGIDLSAEPMVKEIKAVTRHRPFLGRGKDGTVVARVTVDL